MAYGRGRRRSFSRGFSRSRRRVSRRRRMLRPLRIGYRW